jgi:predicted transcriptional regulator
MLVLFVFQNLQPLHDMLVIQHDIKRGTTPHYGEMSHDDILDAKIQRKLLNKNLNRPREYFEKRRMNNILKIIPDEGMHHDQLAHWLGIDRKTLRPYMERLQKMGLVTREPGRHGKYFLTKKTHRGTVISADIFAESFKEKFLDSLNEKFVLDSPYFIPSVHMSVGLYIDFSFLFSCCMFSTTGGLGLLSGSMSGENNHLKNLIR